MRKQKAFWSETVCQVTSVPTHVGTSMEEYYGLFTGDQFIKK